ncbi:efflux RND transporter periplasmic adaptor subunit [Kordiimonas pumila]|uniref:Efflux RND transporter periplasmic adaptor subunit n=1 Tax=Kordiimonas pumila TaxID=2161677 RepID=A0ABV7D6G3_9PROT|nr:efflux RND transporter periplasmic adaptor subunit [Kordiimonas pumila]
MSKIVKFVVPAVVLLASIGSVIALDAAKSPPEKTEIEERPTSLYVDTVKTEDVRLTVTTQGEVKAKTEIALMPQVSGRIVSISESFAEGAGFGSNATLIKIDDADYNLALATAEARVAQTAVVLEKEMADARIKRKQWDEWVKDGQPTPLALNAPQVAEAQAQKRAAEADLETAKLNLSRTNVSVPFHGKVLERSVGLGQIVTPSTELGRVFATDVVEVRLPLTDTQLAEIDLPIGFVSNGTNAPEVTFSSTVHNKSYSWVGHIVRVNAAIDRQTRLIYAVAEVQDPYGQAADMGKPLAVGMFVKATIKSAIPTKTMVMPRLALRGDDRIYVVKDNKLEIRTVDVISTSDDNVYVSSGVAEGEMVVTSAVRAAYSGMPVSTITRAAGNTLSDTDR